MYEQGLLYTRTDFLPKDIAKIGPRTRFNLNKSGVAQIPCAIKEILKPRYNDQKFKNYLRKKYMTNT